METQKDQNHPKVTITNTIFVYPKALHPPKILNLSNLDRQCPLLMYLVFFYKPSLYHNQNLSFNTIFDRLKIGLEETLSEYYPAAGRLNSGDGGKLELWCNSGGAVMAKALTQVKIDELGDLSKYNEFFESLVLKPFVNENNINEMSLVVAQVTKFGCGGYSIGIGTSHSLFDGTAAFDFISAWASQAKNYFKENNNNNNNNNNKPLLLVHERGRLLAASNTNNNMNDQTKLEGISRIDYSNNQTIIRPVAAIDHLYQLIKQAGINNSTNDYDKDNYVLRTFHISGEMIDKLKKKIYYGEESFLCSTFEILAAHLWKARTKALRLEEKERMVCLQFSVDIRSKMSPPLPQYFTGNAFVLASISSTSSLLQQQTLKSIIESIKQAKNSITNEYVENYIKALEGPPDPQQQTRPPEYSLPPLKELTMVSDWTRVPFQTVGFMGEDAAYVCPLVPPLPEVAFFMQSPKERMGVDVRIGLLPQFFDTFSHYFLGEFE